MSKSETTTDSTFYRLQKPIDANDVDGLGISSSQFESLIEAIVSAAFGDSSVERHQPERAIRAQVSSVRSGRSEANSYEILLHDIDLPHAPIASFIAKHYSEPDGEETATTERKNLQYLQTHASDHFSCTVITLPHEYASWTVVRHARDQVRSELAPFHEEVAEILLQRDTKRRERLTENLLSFEAALRSVYDRLSPAPQEIPGNDYYNEVAEFLPPDLVISCGAAGHHLDHDTLIVLGCQGTQPSLDHVESTSFEQLLSSGPKSQTWIKLSGCLICGTTGLDKSPPSRRRRHLALDYQDRRIWVQLPEDECELPDVASRITVIAQVSSCHRLREVLQQVALQPDAVIAPQNIRDLCKLFTTVDLRLRHNDLHTDNLLVSVQQTLKIIDGGSLAYDLPFVATARLEVSFLYQLSNRLESVSAADVYEVLSSCESRPSPEDSSNFTNHSLSVIIRAIRGSSPPDHILSPHVVLAYSLQCAYFERYCLFSASPPVRASFAGVISYWHDKLKEIVRAGVIEPVRLAYSQSSQSEAYTVSEDDSPNIFSLWKRALYSERDESIPARAQAILASLTQGAANSRLAEADLTDLQDRLYLLANEAILRKSGDNPFSHDRHVVIAGPTSSGKSTIAEMFLLHACCANRRLNCAVYIAPTRALTQAKYSELRSRFASSPQITREIVISTGEDVDDDWRIHHGKFSVACLVYEKANLLFSQTPALLAHLGCLLIDEFHMITELERGPALELAITKALQYRDDEQEFVTHREPNREYLKIVTISTEESPPQSVVDFLSVKDGSPPTLLISDIRPVAVHHHLVLAPTDTRDASFVVHGFVEFSEGSKRHLSAERRSCIERELRRLDIHYYESGAGKALSTLDPRYELQTRLNSFLLRWLERNPYGKRILVFVPAKREAEDAGRRLGNDIRKGSIDREKFSGLPSEASLAESIEPLLEHCEDNRLAGALRDCSGEGILFHHADMDKKMRSEIEGICARMPPSARSQVLFATETLSYGVNLHVNDVAIMGVEFYTQSRRGARMRLALSESAFHNMAGRAGRLGITESGNVYVFVPAEMDPMYVISSYYKSVSPPRSCIYVKDDQSSQVDESNNPFALLDPLGESPGRSTLSAMDFTYPFVRTVLDALRHLNLQKRSPNFLGRFALCEDVLRILGRSVQGREILAAKDDKLAKRFQTAVDRILESCSEEPLFLTELEKPVRERKRYRVTHRGHAIIDTGTKLVTVAPLLHLISALEGLWVEFDLSGDRPGLPPELYLLAILPQEEVISEYLLNLPETLRKSARRAWASDTADANREFLRSALEDVLTAHGIIVSDEFVSAVWSAIDDTISRGNVSASVRPSYDGSLADGVIRMFVAVSYWILGRERNEVVEAFEGHELLEERLRGNLQNWRSLTELLGWKIVFAAKMLVNPPNEDRRLDPIDEGRLYSLSFRLKLGCVDEAIPLFWPGSSDFNRSEAARLIGGGWTPSAILMARNLVGSSGINEIEAAKLSQLRGDLEDFAISSFMQLNAEMTLALSRDEGAERASLDAFWKGLERELPLAIRDYIQQTDSAATLGQLMLGLVAACVGEEVQGQAEDMCLFTASSEDYRVYARGASSSVVPTIELKGLELGNRPLEDDDRIPERVLHEDRTLRVVGVNADFKWNCRCSGSDVAFSQWLSDSALSSSSRHLVVVYFPWLPPFGDMSLDLVEALRRRKEANCDSTVFVSFTAFVVALTSLVRGFAGGKDVMELLGPRNSGSLCDHVCLADVTNLLRNTIRWSEVPAQIRERLVRHFEVDSYTYRGPLPQ